MDRRGSTARSPNDLLTRDAYIYGRARQSTFTNCQSRELIVLYRAAEHALYQGQDALESSASTLLRYCSTSSYDLSKRGRGVITKCNALTAVIANAIAQSNAISSVVVLRSWKLAVVDVSTVVGSSQIRVTLTTIPTSLPNYVHDFRCQPQLPLSILTTCTPSKLHNCESLATLLLLAN